MSYVESIGLTLAQKPLINWKDLDAALVLIPPSVSKSALGDRLAMLSYVESGGKVVFLAPREDLFEFLPLAPQRISSRYKHTWDAPAKWGAEYVDIGLDNPLAREMVPVDDMRWWNADDDVGPRLADWVFDHPAAMQKSKPGTGNVKSLADYLAPHGGLKQPADLDEFRGSAVLEWTLGKGRLVASTLRLADDPVARKALANLLGYLLG